MQGLVYREEQDWNDNGDALYVKKFICIDKAIHVLQNLCERDSFWILGQCDGSCAQSTVEMPADVKIMIEESLREEKFTRRMIFMSPEENSAKTDSAFDKNASEDDVVAYQMDCSDHSGGTVTLGDLINWKRSERGNRQSRKGQIHL